MKPGSFLLAACAVVLIAGNAAAQHPRPRPRAGTTKWDRPDGDERAAEPRKTTPPPARWLPAPSPAPGSPPPPAPAARPEPATGTRARYRVTVNGFTAHHETWDHALQVDGKRDEIFLTKDVIVVDRTHDVQVPAAVRTKVFGDVNGFRSDERVQAGSASTMGGIRNGNAVPYDSPWIRRQGAQADRLPWMVWEGELADGENAVAMIIEPWEYDGGQDAYGDWVRWAQSVARALKQSDAFGRLVGERGRFVLELSDLGLGLALGLQESGVLGNAQDRPIGLVRTGTAKGKPVYGANPRLLTLNFRTAELALQQNFGMGYGVIPIRYTDDPKFAGDYELYVQVERLP